MMNPELETKIEAYLLAEMSAAERAQFEQDMALSADLRNVVGERAELATLVRRAFIRERVREAQGESSEMAADVPEVRLRPVASGQPFRYAIAAGFAVVLAAAAYFLWQKTEQLQAEIAAAEPAKEAPGGRPDTSQPSPSESAQPAAGPSNIEKTPEKPATDDGIKIITDRKPQPKIADNQPAPTTDRNLAPETYGTQSRSPRQNGSLSEKGEAIYQAAHVKPDISRFRKTSFDSFVSLFEKGKYADAADRLSKMAVAPADEDGRDLLLGIAALETGDTNRAVRHLNYLYDSRNPYYEDCQWWLALAFARSGRLESARDLLGRVSKSAGHPFRAQAEAALRNF